MRRFALALFVCAGVLAGASCRKSDQTPTPPDDVDTRPPTPPEWDRPVTRPDEATAAASRAACKFARGAMPAETLGATLPVDSDIPITTIVVLMMENRSFDSYYGHLGKLTHRTDIESAPDDATNPDPSGATHPYQHAPHLCFLDTDHSWAGSHREYNAGKMDGFYDANQNARDPEKDAGIPDGGVVNLADGERALWWYDERDIPFYYALGSTFAIADHYHSGLLGPTWPNRMYLYSATSFGLTENTFPDLGAFHFPDNDGLVFDELEKRHVDWNIYADGPPGVALVVGSSIVSRWGRNPVLRTADFFDQAKQGTLPPVVFVDPKFPLSSNGAQNDEHPPGDIQVGQKFASDVVHALFASPQWAHVALFITYDEHGGIYDHVAPPPACPPDALAAKLTPTDPPGAFDRLGVRVPLTVVSPYAKRAYVSHVVYDHSSITRFIEAKFKIPALTARDANAVPPLDMFDFGTPAFATPPTIAEPAIDPTELGYCTATFGSP